MVRPAGYSVWFFKAAESDRAEAVLASVKLLLKTYLAESFVLVVLCQLSVLL